MRGVWVQPPQSSGFQLLSRCIALSIWWIFLASFVATRVGELYLLNDIAMELINQTLNVNVCGNIHGISKQSLWQRGFKQYRVARGHYCNELKVHSWTPRLPWLPDVEYTTKEKIVFSKLARGQYQRDEFYDKVT